MIHSRESLTKLPASYTWAATHWQSVSYHQIKVAKNEQLAGEAAENVVCLFFHLKQLVLISHKGQFDYRLIKK